MHTRKVKVKEEKSDYICYYPYPCSRLPIINENGCYFTSIDIAIKAFAIRIEKRFSNGNIELLYFNKLDFRDSENGEIETENKGTTKINPSILSKINIFLNSLLSVFYNAPESLICIERQMAINYKSTRIFQHVLTFFMIHAPHFKNYCMIVDVNPQLKGRIHDAPKRLTYNELKAWSISKAIEILQRRNDNISLSVLSFHQGKSKTKADDLADTVIQLEALIQVLYFGK